MTDGAGPPDEQASFDDPDWVEQMLARALESADDEPGEPQAERTSENRVERSSEPPGGPPDQPVRPPKESQPVAGERPAAAPPPSDTRPTGGPQTPTSDDDAAWSSWAAGGAPPAGGDAPDPVVSSQQATLPEAQPDWTQQQTQAVPAAAGATALLVDDEYDDEAPETSRAKSRARSIAEWVAVLVGALLFAFLIKTFLFQAFYIPSGSMEPTLSKNDRVLVNKLSYDLHDVNRGDIVVFNKPPDEQSDINHLIKRVIGLPGETITFADGKVFIDNREVSESYILEPESTDFFVEIPNCEGSTPNGCKIPEDRVFVMGDNRRGSRDSRFFGPIEESSVIGRAFLKIWPITSIGLL